MEVVKKHVLLPSFLFDTLKDFAGIQERYQSGLSYFLFGTAKHGFIRATTHGISACRSNCAPASKKPSLVVRYRGCDWDDRPPP